MMKDDKKRLCHGCRDDFYNRDGECWALKTAHVVTRYRLGWWTTPTSPGAFRKVRTLTCHYEPGRYAFLTALPDFVTPEERARLRRGRHAPD